MKSIHLEITDKCNVSCPMCARNLFGGRENEFIQNAELSLDDCKNIFPTALISTLDKMYMCGNYGDPIVARDTKEVFAYFREHNPMMKLGMNTNGSARSPKWWGELANSFKVKGSYVKFGLDGLGDTNHIYRRGSNWDKIMANMKAFIAAGGRAHWDFIVFKHNEHQVEEARAIAKEMGVIWFQVKKTGRFFSNAKMSGKDSQEVHDKKGNVEYFIEKPINPKYVNTALEDEQTLINTYGSLENYLDNTRIECRTKKEESIFVSAEGLVFPCCWTANQLYLWYFPKMGAPIWKMFPNKDSISGKLHNINDIVNGEFFQKIENSWGCSSIKDGKLKVCAKTCGVGFDQFGAQFK